MQTSGLGMYSLAGGKNGDAGRVGRDEFGGDSADRVLGRLPVVWCEVRFARAHDRLGLEGPLCGWAHRAGLSAAPFDRAHDRVGEGEYVVSTVGHGDDGSEVVAVGHFDRHSLVDQILLDADPVGAGAG